MSPAWKTPTFWIMLATKLLAVLCVAGAMTTADEAHLAETITKAIMGVFSILAAAKVICEYVRGHHNQAVAQIHRAADDAEKNEIQEDGPGPNERSPLKFPSGPDAILIFLGLFLGSGQIQAQQVQRTCLFGCRCGGQQKADPAMMALLQQILAGQQQQHAPQMTDPAVMSILNQLAAQNGQILALLQGPQHAPAPTTPISGDRIVLLLPPSQGGPLQNIPLGGPPLQSIPLGGPPLQQIPLGGPPLQAIPLGGPPLQQVPLGGPPLQQIPLGGAPQQQVPLGAAPQQQLPIGPAPQQPLPLGSQPKQVIPGPAPQAAPPTPGPQQQIPLGTAPDKLAPVSYQRFTQYTWRAARQ